MRLSRLSIKRASTKGFIFASKHWSWLTTLCQTLWENCQSVQRRCLSAQDCKEFRSFTIHSSQYRKDSGSQGKSHWVKAKGGTATEYVWSLSPQAVLFEKPSFYHDGNSHMGSGVLWKIIVTQHSPPLHQEMQLEIVLLCAWLAWSVSYWKCMAHNKEENQTMATTDCWAAQVLYTPRTGKNATCKTATIDFFSSQTITKCNYKKRWCYPVVNMPLYQLFLSILQASIFSKFV